MFVGFKDVETANRVFSSVRREEKSHFATGFLHDAPPVIGLEIAARDGGLGRPAYHSVWDAKSQKMIRFSDSKARAIPWTIGLFVGFDKDGSPIYITSDDEDYYPEYGYYDDGDGGTSWSHDAILNLGCDTASGDTQGDIVYDKVRYTATLIIRNRRPFVSISMRVLEENVVAVNTVCKEVVIPTGTTAECVDGDIVLTLQTEKIRVIDCVVCP